MLKRLAFVLFCISTPLFGSDEAARGKVSVDELLTKISITEEAVSPELVIENPGPSKSAHVLVQLLDPNDAIRASAERDAQITPGLNRVRLDLKGWKQKAEEWNDSVWYRVRYNVTLPPPNESVVEGILALSTKARGVFDMRVVTSREALPGKPLLVRVYTQSVSDLRPVAGVQVKAELDPDDDGTKLTGTAFTDAKGYAQLEFKVPPSWTGSADVKVIATKGQVVREAKDEVSFTAYSHFFVSTDKPLYQPGQAVHIRALLLDPAKHAVANGSATFTVRDEEDTVVYRSEATSSRFGIARAEWEVPENIRLGYYSIRVEQGNGDEPEYLRIGFQSIRISRYELPTFTVNVKPDRGYYLPGQNASVTISADYLFGKPVTKGHVKVVRETERRWNFKAQRWETVEEGKWEGDVAADGKFVATLDLSKDGEGLEDRQRYRDLTFAAYFTETATRKTEQRRFRLRITRDPIHVYVLETSSFGPGELPLEFYLSTSYADGSPAQCELAIHEGSSSNDEPGPLLRSVKTNKYGVTRVTGLVLPPATGNGSSLDELVVVARDREGRTGKQTAEFDGLHDEKDWRIQVDTDHALYRPNEPVEVYIHANRSDATLLLDVIHDGRVLRSQSVRLRNGHALAILPYGFDFQGELTVAAYSPAGESDHTSMPIATRTVLYPHDPALKVTAKFDRASYRPGEDSVLNLHVRNNHGAPTEAAVGAVIFDKAVEERARTDEDFGGRGYGFYSDFGNYWSSWSQVGGVSRSELDHLDTSEPFPDELQLAAEVLLWDRWGNWERHPNVFGGADYPQAGSQIFGRRFDSELAPLKIALHDAYAKDYTYPRTMDALKKILLARGVDFDTVRDPWGSPFQFKFSSGGSQDVMEVISSGPDKTPGTLDDLSVTKIYWSYFKKTGVAIDKAMDEFHRCIGAYIRDSPTLKAELSRSGIDWNTLHDPWGNSYQAEFGIANTRYTLIIRSAGPNGRFDSSASSDDFPVWTNSTEYFVDTAVRIDSALAAHYAATQSFPQTETEFYRVLDDAKISRNDLQDAWGHKLWPTFDNQARYQDRVVIDYSAFKSGSWHRVEDIKPETKQYAFVHLHSAGLDGKSRNFDDFEIWSFSREVARQNSKQPEPIATPGSVPLNGELGGINGVVTDQTGAVIGGTEVVASQEGKGRFTARTDANGRYVIRNLPPGLYVLTATSSGFSISTVTRVPVNSLRITEVDFTLFVGSSMETVNVEAAAVASIQTDSAEVSVVRGSGGTAGVISTPRLREFFPETLLWEPLIETDASGNSRLRFKFADSITDWKLSVVASTVDGQVGLLDTSIKTFQPFFIEHEPPQVVTQGDEINLPVVLRNYLNKPQKLHVEMKAEPWFTLLGPSSQETSVSAGESQNASFRFRVAGRTGSVKQRVTAANQETGDAIEKPVLIHPDGEPLTSTAARLFRGKGDLELSIPEYVVPGSLAAELKIYPNLISHVLESTRGLLERPYGCGEQTISSTYPNVMVLRLYKQFGKKPDAVYRTALKYANLGYSRLLSYQHEDGAFSVWKNGKPDGVLTAYALRFLEDAREFIAVDAEVVGAAQQYLLRTQNADGSWGDPGQTAYVVYTLRQGTLAKTKEATANKNVKPLEPALAAAGKFLESDWSITSDPYVLAHVSLAAFATSNNRLTAQVNAKLRSLAHHEAESSYWAMETNTLFHSWGRAGRAETTALVVQALAHQAETKNGTDAAKQDQSLIEGGLLFLIHQKDGYGVWYSGQATVNVLQAFLLLGNTASDASSRTAEVFVNGTKAADVKFPASNDITAPLMLDVTRYVRTGTNRVSISSSGVSETASWQVVARYYIPWERSSAQGSSGIRPGDSDAVALRVSYDSGNARPGDDIRCRVHAERIGFRGYGMLLAEIGLPPGAVVDRGSIEKVMNGDDWSISQYEIQPDRVVVYLWPRAGGTNFEFTFRERYEVNALTAPSILYDYYNPDARTVVKPSRIEAKELSVAER